MTKNNLYAMEQNLRSIAKKYKNVKYSIGLVILFLMMGLNAFSQDVMTTEEIAASRETLKNSVENLQDKINTARRENQKEINGLRLELIQLMEQGNQVVKSPWASWQFGANYMYNDWRGTYKGRGDKKEKYPYEGIYTRNSDIFLRNVSPDSELYEQYISTAVDKAAYSSISSTIKQRGGSTSYGLASNNNNQEPIASIELGASVKPKNISKSPITVTPPSITVNPVTPLNTPEPPEPPQLPRIEIETFNPVAPDPIRVSLPTPPTFNIKLGSFCNPMCGGGGTNGRAYLTANGTPIGVATKIGNVTTDTDIRLPANATNNPSLRYSWSHMGSTLFKVYFDYTGGGTGGGTGKVISDPDVGRAIVIDSINPLDGTQRAAETAAGRVYNGQNFLVGGSRIATMDNVRNGHLENTGEVNLVGPLVVGYEIQTDTNIHNQGVQGIREVKNTGIITDKAEEGYRGADGLGGLKVGIAGSPTVLSNNETLQLSTGLGGGSINVKRTEDIVDATGNVITPGGYVGYKIGLILTTEDNDTYATSDYRLINGAGGNIAFKGKSSIGIQIYAPGSNSSHITVKNDGNITMGGIESYGLKLSSRVSDQNMTFENNGNINIAGAGGNSLSSGIAILEDGNLTGNASIRAYT